VGAWMRVVDELLEDNELLDSSVVR
jgi:hypothetical protein